MIVRCSLANSISGPLMIRTRPAFGVVGLICADIGFEKSRLPAAAVIASFRMSLFIYRPHSEITNEIQERPSKRGMGPQAPHASTRLDYGIAGLGTGATPQIAVAQAGSVGVGIRK